MIFPDELNKKSVMQAFWDDKLRNKHLPKWLIDTKDYSSDISYSIMICLDSTKNFFSFDCIKEIALSRHSRSHSSLREKRVWAFESVPTKLNKNAFDESFWFSYPKENGARALSLIAIMTLFTLFDSLSGNKRDGLIFRSEIYSLRKYGLWKIGGREIDYDLQNIVDSIMRSAKYIKRANRRIKILPFLNEFLFDANEIFNIVSYIGKDKVPGNNQLLHEYVYSMNLSPSKIEIFLDQDKLDNATQLLSILKCLFYTDCMLSTSKLNEYKKIVEKGGWPSFKYEKCKLPAAICDNIKLSLTKKSQIAIKNIKPDTISYDKIEFYVKKKAPLYCKYYSKELDKWLEKQREANDLWITEQNIKSIPLIEESMITEVLRKYYGCNRSKTVRDSFYSFRINDFLYHTNNVTKKSWLKPIELSLKSNNYELVQLDKPNILLPQIPVKQLIDYIIRSGDFIHRGNSYRLTSIKYKPGNFKVSFSEIDFVHYKFTIGLLHNEISKAIIDLNYVLTEIDAKPQIHLPLRKILLPDLSSILNFKQRICSGGVAVLFAVANEEDDDFIFWIQERSDQVCDGGNMLSVLPVGLHQYDVNSKKEINLCRSVLREFIEELIDEKEIEFGRKKFVYDYYENHRVYKWLMDNPNEWFMENVAFLIDATSGAYTFGILFVITCNRFWRDHNKFFGVGRETEGKEQFSSKNDLQKISEYLKKPNWNHDGLITFIEGLKRLKFLFDDKVNIPDIDTISPKYK